MIRQLQFILAVALVAFTTILAGVPSARADITCSGTVGNASTVTNISGNVVVPNGASCTLIFVNVTGNVTAGLGSTLLINAYTEPSTVGGNVTATDCSSALLEGLVTVNGNVSISSCTNGPNGFQGPDTLIQGTFSCESNVVAQATMPCLAWLGKVVGNVTISSNVSQTPPDVSLLTTSGTLDCESNNPAPTHSHGPSWVDGSSMGQCSGFATTATSISAGSVTPAASCAALANLAASGFPVPNTVITSAVDTAAGGGLPERCIINGYVNRHTSPVDTCFYQDGFQVQLPLPSAWNGRFMMEGGGGSEGSVPVATGTIGGSTGIVEITNGYAIASQDGGHENTDLANCINTNPNTFGNANEYALDPQGLIGQSYESIEVTALVAKYLINQYYGTGPNRSYWVGCSTGGRQAMVMSQNFPSFFDGIVAGDPVYDQEKLGLSEINGVEAILNLYLNNPALTPPGPTMIAQAAPEPAGPHLYPAFPSSDQSLFETALLQNCDALDGVADGVIDNVPACVARFNPATAMWTDYTGALGPAGATYPLQCTGAKSATCLSPGEIQAAIQINQGPRMNGGPIDDPAGAVAPDPVSNAAQGYEYDGGWMATTGIPSRKIGTSSSTSLPGDFSLGVGTFGYLFTSPLCPTCYTLNFNFNTGTLTQSGNTYGMNPSTPVVSFSTSLNMTHFINYGHKMIWYHGASDPGPPILQTKVYLTQLAEQNGGWDNAQSFFRFYPIPGMDHCTGGPTTDGFDFLTPLVNWVESGAQPAGVTSSGTNFNAATYQVVGNYITGGFINAPATRSRTLCPWPQQARFTGSTTLVNGVPVASNPSDLANASNYTCINLVQTATHDFNGDRKSDILWRDLSNNIGMWLMNGPTISQTGVLGNVSAFWSVVGQRDFTGTGFVGSGNNGDADVLWRDTAGDVGMWLMNGTQIESSTTLGNVPTSWSVVGTGDLNGDSFGDILWRDTSGNLGVWFMNGASIMQTAIIGNVPLSWSVAGVDSKGDIFWYNTSTGEVGMWVMNGTKVVQSVDFGAVPSNWKIAGIGDFDGNGSTDILWRDTSGNVGVWLLNGTSILSTSVIGNVPLNWSIAQTGDYNGNGEADILWVDNLGNVAVWFMNGASISSVSNYGNIGTAWTAQSTNAE
jgi:Tannase and feruloyl esterase/FG-GAP-like repeat